MQKFPWISSVRKDCSSEIWTWTSNINMKLLINGLPVYYGEICMIRLPDGGDNKQECERGEYDPYVLDCVKGGAG